MMHLIYLKNKLPRFRRPLYSLININTFHGIRCKSDRYMNSFFPDGVNSCNNVISHFKTIPSMDIFKRHFLSLVRPEKRSIFGIHDPSGLRILFQLRVGLSTLRYHKNVTTLSIHLLTNVVAVMAMKTLIISFFRDHSVLLVEHC